MSTLSVPLASRRRPSGSVSSLAQDTPWAGAPGLRIRWSRVVTLSMLLLAAMAVGALMTGMVGGGGGAASAGAPRGDGAVVQPSTALVVHTVAPGDTLWAIATALDPAADPRPMVDRIMALNNLSTGEVAVGTQLLVPARP